MTDDKFEDFVQREAAAAYNPPPGTVPRDEMFDAIQAPRRAQAATSSVGGATPLPSKRPPRLRYAPWIGMAATLLVGVGIGRFALVETPSAPTTIAAAPGAEPSASSGTEAAASSAVDAPNSSAPTTTSDAAVPATRVVPLRTGATQVAAEPAVPRAGQNGSTESAALQLRSRDHLTRAEALVSVIASTTGDATMDSLTVRWAREMLTNTRLLLDSPVGDDPVRRRLLEDLETVLVQLVQRSGGAVDERALIDRTLERTQLLTRLRSGAAGI